MTKSQQNKQIALLMTCKHRDWLVAKLKTYKFYLQTDKQHIIPLGMTAAWLTDQIKLLKIDLEETKLILERVGVAGD